MLEESISSPTNGDNIVPIVMTANEVAALLRCGISTVYKYKDCDGLPYHQWVAGGAVRFYQHEVLEWMSRHRQSADL